MTAKEFDKLRLAIEKERFYSNSTDPISYAIERTAFEQDKLKRLIAAARQVEGKLAQIKMEKWQRMLERANRSQARMEQRREEIRANKPVLFAAYRQARALKPA